MDFKKLFHKKEPIAQKEEIIIPYDISSKLIEVNYLLEYLNDLSRLDDSLEEDLSDLTKALMQNIQSLNSGAQILVNIGQYPETYKLLSDELSRINRNNVKLHKDIESLRTKIDANADHLKLCLHIFEHLPDLKIKKSIINKTRDADYQTYSIEFYSYRIYKNEVYHNKNLNPICHINSLREKFYCINLEKTLIKYDFPIPPET
jgi:chromosome segregation ATPase